MSNEQTPEDGGEVAIHNIGTVLENKDAVEPAEYFKFIKASETQITRDDIEAQLAYVGEEALRARNLGQKALQNKLLFTASVLIREMTLQSIGIRKSIDRDALMRFIHKVKPKNSVKLIELDRYQRIIPESAANRIKEVRDANIFDDFLILFTDFTGKDYSSPQEKKYIERNRDPICFGVFRETKTGEAFDRCYLIAEWEDDHCELTWSKLVSSVRREDIRDINPDAVALIKSINTEAYRYQPLDIERRARGQKKTWLGLWKRIRENLAHYGKIGRD